jgi:hypothetical protein
MRTSKLAETDNFNVDILKIAPLDKMQEMKQTIQLIYSALAAVWQRVNEMFLISMKHAV